MLIEILALLAILVVVFLIVVVLRPADFRVTRAASISAPPEVAFAQVNDLRKWEAWNPWLKLDPAVKNSYEGPTTGVGTISRWDGNKVGAGSMIITESRPAALIRFKLEFLRPFKATNTAEFTFEPAGSQTVVTWSMAGRNNFVCKAVSLFINFDKMCGSQFEKGLADLKSVAESAYAGAPARLFADKL